MIVSSYDHVLTYKCPTGKYQTFVFNIEPIHGDFLESIRISEIPKDSSHWDDSTQSSLPKSTSASKHKPRTSLSESENESPFLRTDSPRTNTLETFGSDNLFLEGFGQRDEKMLMLTLGTSPQQVVLPWTEWNKLSSSTIDNQQDPLDNEVILFSKDNEKFCLPVASLWKSRFRLYLRVTETLAKNCKYCLITMVSVDSNGSKKLQTNQFLLNPPFLPGVLIFEEDSPLTFIRFEEISKITN